MPIEWPPNPYLQMWLVLAAVSISTLLLRVTSYCEYRLELPLFPLPLLFAVVGTRAVLLFLSLLSAVEEVVERHPVGQNLRFDVEPCYEKLLTTLERPRTGSAELPM